MTVHRPRNPIYVLAVLALAAIALITFGVSAQDATETARFAGQSETPENTFDIEIDRGNHFTVNFWKSDVHSWTGYRGIEGRLVGAEEEPLQNLAIRLVRFDWIDANKRYESANLTQTELYEQRDEWVELGETVRRTDADGAISFGGLKWGIYSVQPIWDEIPDDTEIIKLTARLPANAPDRANDQNVAGPRILPWAPAGT